MPEVLPDNWWPDDDYVPYLEAEQQLYAWILTKVGGVEPGEAMRRAVARFHYESMSERGLMTHAGAWDIAMCDLFGGHRRDPEDFGLAEEFDAQVRRLFHGDSRTLPQGIPLQRWIALDNTEGVILPAELGFPWSYQGLEYWTPVRSHVIWAEVHVGLYLQFAKPELAQKLDRYKRQYSGVLKGQNKLIYLNFFVVNSDRHDDWTTKPVDVDDGGDNYFHVFFDLKATAFEGLVINGCA